MTYESKAVGVAVAWVKDPTNDNLPLQKYIVSVMGTLLLIILPTTSHCR